jgi:hypothetical protein
MKIFGQMNKISECDPNKPYHPDPYVVNFDLKEFDEIALTKCYDMFQ